MKEYNFIKNKLIERHKEIDSEYYLNKYISLLLEYKLDDDSEVYTEKHHILPRSTFPEYKNEDWNIVEINYEDHRLAHLYLFKSINIRTYQRPLNWMMNYYKNSEEISKASKRGWKKLKVNDKKFNEWKECRRKHMKSLSSEEQRRRANLFWDNITEEEYLAFSKKMKDYWTDEKRKEKSKEMNEYYTNPENVEKKRKETKERWDSMSDVDRENFKDKMSSINKDKSKRLDAGEKIKNKWKDPDYLNKMKNRKKRSGTKIKIINNDGESEIFDNMQDVVRKYNFSSHLIRKYKNTNNKVLKEHLNNDNINLLDSIIETVK